VLRYALIVFWSDEDGSWVADVPDLKSCSAFGDTPEEAVAEVRVGRWILGTSPRMTREDAVGGLWRSHAPHGRRRDEGHACRSGPRLGFSNALHQYGTAKLTLREGLKAVTDPDTHRALRLKELEYLRKEIEYRTIGQAVLERNVVVAISAVYVALATLDISKLAPPLASLSLYFWIIPFLVAVGGAARFFDDHNAIRDIGGYIARIERELDPESGGWECYRSGQRKGAVSRYNQRWARLPWQIRRSSWFVLILLTMAMPVLILWLR
jgi:hypothetical protein